MLLKFKCIKWFLLSDSSGLLSLFFIIEIVLEGIFGVELIVYFFEEL